MVFINWFVRMHVCVCVRLRGEYLAFYISKTNKDRKTKFCTQYQINELIMFPGFGKNRKTGSDLRGNGNKTESEYL